MPSSVRLSKTRIISALRVRDGKSSIGVVASDDNGKTWSHLSDPAPDTGGMGNPPSMIRLKDGRICLTYGYRRAPYGVRARLSSDDGKSWGDEIVLRDDGIWDLGYPRTTQRPDGKIVTVYYFAPAEDQERYIAATIWDPGKK